MQELITLAPQIGVALAIVGAAWILNKRSNGYATQESLNLLREDVTELKQLASDTQRAVIRLEERYDRLAN
jgi:hypothetical protein